MGDRILDTFGVPEYFTTHLGEIEDAGNGLVRVVRCIKRNGVLIPVFSQIIPAAAVLESMPTITTTARNVLRGGDGPRH